MNFNLILYEFCMRGHQFNITIHVFVNMEES